MLINSTVLFEALVCVGVASGSVFVHPFHEFCVLPSLGESHSVMKQIEHTELRVTIYRNDLISNFLILLFMPT